MIFVYLLVYAESNIKTRRNICNQPETVKFAFKGLGEDFWEIRLRI